MSQTRPSGRRATRPLGRRAIKPANAIVIERIQTGVRMEKRMLKVLKALADSLDITLGDLLEGIVLHAFEGKAPFSAPTRKKVADLKKVFGLTLTAADAHNLEEKGRGPKQSG